MVPQSQIEVGTANMQLALKVTWYLAERLGSLLIDVIEKIEQFMTEKK